MQQLKAYGNTTLLGTLTTKQRTKKDANNSKNQIANNIQAFKGLVINADIDTLPNQ